jgi:hypothetical protein
LEVLQNGGFAKTKRSALRLAGRPVISGFENKDGLASESLADNLAANATNRRMARHGRHHDDIRAISSSPGTPARPVVNHF